MNYSANKHLQYFKGKFCSIFTVPSARELTPEQYNDYFVGLVQEMDEIGIVTLHAITGCRNFFMWSNIIGISEEQFLSANNEEDAKLIDQIKKNSEPVVPNSKFIDISAMQQLSQKAKELSQSK